MDKLILIVLSVIVVGAVGGAVVYYQLGGGSSTAATTTTTTTTITHETTTIPTTTTSGTMTTSTQTSTTSATPPDIVGTWSGTYTGMHGSGEWTWVIQRTGENEYTGHLSTTGTYSTGGWIPINIKLEGNKITIGTVGGYAVVFTGTIQGTSASGNWHFTNMMDQGSWSGTRISTVTTISTTPMTRTTTTTTTSAATTTTTSSGGSSCPMSPPQSYASSYNSIIQVAVNVFGEDNIQCVTSSMVGGSMYYAVYSIVNYDVSQTQTYADNFVTGLQRSGWQIVQTTSSGADYIIQVTNMQGFGANIVLSFEANNATLSIQFQPIQ